MSEKQETKNTESKTVNKVLVVEIDTVHAYLKIGLEDPGWMGFFFVTNEFDNINSFGTFLHKELKARKIPIHRISIVESKSNPINLWTKEAISSEIETYARDNGGEPLYKIETRPQKDFTESPIHVGDIVIRPGSSTYGFALHRAQVLSFQGDTVTLRDLESGLTSNLLTKNVILKSQLK